MHPKSKTLLEVHIFMAKKGIKQKKYSAEFKIGVILDMREHHLGYRETVRKYGLARQSESAAGDMIKRWERIYLEEGAEGLMKERRGRSNKCKTGRPPKLDKKTEEDLIAENQRLRMEIEYIKKLSALVREREERERKRKR